MSEPQRFRVADNQAQITLGGQIMEVHPDGPYVTYSEYARLAFKNKCQAEGLNAFDNKLRQAEGLIARMNDTINESQAEVRRLKAEVERLTQLNSTLALRYDATNSMLDGCAKEIEEMEAQVERLTKAGDDLHCFLIGYIVENRLSSSYLNKLDDDWNKALNKNQP
jgi:chromosome segregation ATPase